ncbi:hypothetical protein [Nocardia tengchongensis]
MTTNATQRPELVVEAVGYLDNSAPSPRGAAIAAALLRSDHVT